ncbi:hypothetical protein QTP86_003083 [Hemibagrus guttatus]|nr:hypothetical protein QTP86_003083 [Hemibagrus guttatus]
MVGLISKNNESVYREEVQQLIAWCKVNNLSMNVDKTKEMVVDFRRAHSGHSLLYIDGSSVEIVKSTKFLGVHLTENLTWSLNTSSITKKAQQCLYFLQKLRKAHLPPPILTAFYRGTVKSILSRCITAWFGNCKTLQRTMRKPIVEKMRRERINSSMEKLKSLLGGEFLKQQPDSRQEKADILEMTVYFLRQQQQQSHKKSSCSTAADEGYSRCVQEAVNFLSQCQVHTQSQRRLLSHFLTMQPSMEKSRNVPQLSSPTCQISSKEETPGCSGLWRPW